MLQRNVPGRFSSWADEADDAEDRSRAASDSEPEEDVVDNDDEGPAATAPVNDDDGLVALEYRRGHNTGPKAVLADHQAHQRAAYERREQAKVRLRSISARNGFNRRICTDNTMTSHHTGPPCGDASPDRARR